MGQAARRPRPGCVERGRARWHRGDPAVAVFPVADVMVPGLRKRRYSQEMVSGMLMKQEQSVVVLFFLFFFPSPETFKVAGPAKPLVTNEIPAPRVIVWPCCRVSCSRAAAASHPLHQHPACCLLCTSAAPTSEGGYLFKSNACAHLLGTAGVKNRSLIPGCSACCFLPKEKLRYG